MPTAKTKAPAEAGAFSALREFLALRILPAALLAAALLSALSGLLRLLAGVLLSALAATLLPALAALLSALAGLLGLLAGFRILRIGIVHQALLFSHLAMINSTEPRMFRTFGN